MQFKLKDPEKKEGSYVRIKENLKAKGVVFKVNNIDLDESEVNEEELIGEMTLITMFKRS